MTKLTFIVATLVPEADNEENKQINKDIRKELKMPYLLNILDYEIHHGMPDGKEVKCYG